MRAERVSWDKPGRKGRTLSYDGYYLLVEKLGNWAGVVGFKLI